jgi:hypothetical protein
MKHALVSLCLLAPACSRTPTRGDCDNLLDHVIELEMAAGGVAATTAEAKAARELQKKKVIGYVGQDFVKSCVEELPLSQLNCGLAARTLEELGRCDES